MSGYKALDRSCKTDSYPCTSEYVTQVLTTLLNFAHGALTLRPLVYYSSCLPFLFVSLLPLLCCHVDTLLLLFKIFKCAILTCALCSLHGMTWIYYDYFIFLSVEKSMLAKPTNKQKNTVFSKRDHLESGYQFVCVCVFLFPLPSPFQFVLLSSGGCEITQLYYLGHHMTVSADSFPQKLKKTKNNEYLLICMGLGGEGVRYVWMWAAVRGLTCEYTLH